MIPNKKNHKNHRPVLTIQMADGLKELAQLVKATDSPELIKAARYCDQLADYLKSDHYAKTQETARIRTLQSKINRGVKLSANQTKKALEVKLKALDTVAKPR